MSTSCLPAFPELMRAKYLRDPLNAARYRNFHPTLGRWIERDPAGYLDGANLYGYISGNPAGLIDPSGLCGETVPEPGNLRVEMHLLPFWGDPAACPRVLLPFWGDPADVPKVLLPFLVDPAAEPRQAGSSDGLEEPKPETVPGSPFTGPQGIIGPRWRDMDDVWADWWSSTDANPQNWHGVGKFLCEPTPGDLLDWLARSLRQWSDAGNEAIFASIWAINWGIYSAGEALTPVPRGVIPEVVVIDIPPIPFGRGYTRPVHIEIDLRDLKDFLGMCKPYAKGFADEAKRWMDYYRRDFLETLRPPKPQTPTTTVPKPKPPTLGPP